jgi:RNA polymerase sigma factor (sigma-70 family)
MAKASLTPVVRHVRMLATAHKDLRVGDPDLLSAFISHRDQDAFTSLVDRYGPMVLNVCSRILSQRQDAEDAFQATFLLLARKAASLKERLALASWLYGTARRIAFTIRRSTARRRAHEGRVPVMRARDPFADLAWREVQALLEEEIGRLPGRYQAVFVLRCLENKGQGEVARLLGLKEGTVSSRLDWARKRLKSRLARRGVLLPGVLAATALLPPAAKAISAALSQATARAAVALASGKGIAAELVSPRVIALVAGGLKSMLTGKQMVTGVFLALGLLASAAAMMAGQDAGGKPTEEKQVEPEPFLRRESADTPPRGTANPQESIRGLWTLQTVERGGRRLAVEPSAVQLAVTHRFWIWQEEGEDRAFAYTLRSDQTPKQIDLSPRFEGLENQKQGKSILGIYAITGDELRICESEGARPTAFSAPLGSGFTLYTYRRSGSHLQSNASASRLHQPENLKALETRTREYLQAYRLREARQSVDEWLERQPANPQALFLRAQIHELLPDATWGGSKWGVSDFSAKALADYRRVLELDPEHDDARLRLAEGLLQTATPQEALAHFQRLQKRQPKNPAVRLGMARCLILLGRLEEAGRLLELLLADEPSNASALAERGRLALQEGKLAEAEKLLGYSLAIAPFDRQTMYLMFQCLSALGKQDQAKKFREAMTRMDEYQNRLQEVAQKIQETGEDPALWTEAGSLFLRMGREKEGLAHLNRALQLDPRFKPAHEALADYYQRMGKKELAEKHRALAK